MTSPSHHLVLLETSGNQSFIFATNKLRENVGASEATYRACSQWVLEAVAKLTHKPLWNDNAETLKANLCNRDLNPPIEHPTTPVEVLIAASGKAILITRTIEDAKNIIKTVTLRALKEAPGLDLCGAIESFTWESDNLPEVSRQLHKKFEVVRSLRPGPDLRFLRLPIVEDCRTSGLPAAKLDLEPGTQNRSVPRSTVSLTKRKWAETALNDRLPKLLTDSSYHFAKSTDKTLDERSDSQWLAVIHADGNGLGQIFINLEKHIGDDQTNRNYINTLREFSLDIDICTRNAFIEALSVFSADKDNPKTNPLPLIPLVLGGDDLTVVCDAKYALAFTKLFLAAFEQETQNTTSISTIAANAFHIKPGKLSACAGIAIVKSHFPFSTAYALAEELAKSAKIVKSIVKNGDQVIPCSAIDYHVLYDTSGTNLDAIHDKLTIDKATRLYNRPYITSDIDSVMEMVGQNQPIHDWLRLHQWSELDRRVTAILNKQSDLHHESENDPQDDRRALPNSQMHNLREALFLGKAGANAQYSLIRKRYLKQNIEAIAATDHPTSLFWKDPNPVADQQYCVTGLLDAMDASDFWQSGSPRIGG
jgi:hypothetical protein